MPDFLHDLLSSLEKYHPTKSLEKTPERFRKAMAFFTAGYTEDIGKLVNGAVDPIENGGLVLVKDIEFYSLCEHHLLPFFGRAHIGYIPGGKIIGLSKIPRMVDVFARRLQVQERLGKEIAQALEDILHPKGIAVVLEAEHLCMKMRGVEKECSSVVTHHFQGEMKESATARQEFLSAIAQRRA